MRIQWLSTCAMLIIAVTHAHDIRGDEINDIARSYEHVVSRITTWEGNVTIYKQVDSELKRHYASGTFAWDSASDRRHCRLSYASRRGYLSPGRDVAWEDTVSDRETIVNNAVRTEVWHNIVGLPLEHFEMPRDRPPRHRVAVAKRRHLNPQSLLTPDMEFCPEYMLRGNLPPLVQLLKAAGDHGKEPDVLDYGYASPNEFRIEKLKTNSFLIMKLVSDQWVPHAYESELISLHWQWKHVDDILVPFHLEVNTKEANRREVYTLSDIRINHSIAPSRFEIDGMGFKKGTLLEDVVDDVLLEFDGGKFVRLERPNTYDASTIMRLVGILGIVCAVFIAWSVVRRNIRGRR